MKLTDDEINLLSMDVRDRTGMARLNLAETREVVRRLEEMGFALADDSAIKARAAALAAARAQ